MTVSQRDMSGKNAFNRSIGPPRCRIGNWVEEEQIWDEEMRLISMGERQSVASCIKNPQVNNKEIYRTNNQEIGTFSDEMADQQRKQCFAMKTHKTITKPENVTDYVLDESLKNTKLIDQTQCHDILNKDIEKCGCDISIKPELTEKDESVAPQEVVDYRKQRKTGFW